jgi:antitoxin component YwqK of YwqJK toxin-antitoxin module
MKIRSILFLFCAMLQCVSHAQEEPQAENCPCCSKDPRTGEPRRCGSLRDIPDCNNDLQYEENTNTVYHRRGSAGFTGFCESCHGTGHREHCAQFVNGKEHGVSYTWHDNGHLQFQREHNMGVEVGTWKVWHRGKGTEAGKLASEVNYVNGKMNGRCIWYFEDGSERKIEEYKMGVLDGKVTRYSRPGIKDKEIQYKNGLMDGKYVSFFENGNVQTELNYKAGKENGPIKYFHDNSQLALEGEFRDGVKVGKWSSYYPTGIDMVIENYNAQGQLHGMVFHYWEDGGRLKLEAFYQNGNIAVNKENVELKQEYDEFGNPIDEFGNRVNPDDALNIQAEASRLGSGKGKKNKPPKSTFDFNSLNKELMCDCIKAEQAKKPETQECRHEKNRFRKAMEQSTKSDQKKLRQIMDDCLKK